MRLLLTVSQVVEVGTDEDLDTDLTDQTIDIEAFRDSYQDHLLDGQNTTHETSDGKFLFEPGEIREFTVKELK
jgi:hypothetical protein